MRPFLTTAVAALLALGASAAPAQPYPSRPVKIVVAENQARGRHFRKSKAMRTLNRPIIDMLARVVERGQAAGAFRRDIDPVEVHMAIAALGMFNVTNQYTFGAIFQRDMGTKGNVRARREMAAEVILSYLMNIERRQ